MKSSYEAKVFTFPFKAIDLILEMEMRWANFCWHTFNYVTVKYPQIQELYWLIILQKSIIRFQLILFSFESFDHDQKSQNIFCCCCFNCLDFSPFSFHGPRSVSKALERTKSYSLPKTTIYWKWLSAFSNGESQHFELQLFEKVLKLFLLLFIWN
jgi:hypothetical protein